MQPRLLRGRPPDPGSGALVRSQVMALLEASPAYSQLDAGRQRRMADDLVKIGSYSAELMRDIFQRSEQLGQTPAVLTQTFTRDTPRQARALAGRAPGPASDEFSPRAASNVARITQQTRTPSPSPPSSPTSSREPSRPS